MLLTVQERKKAEPQEVSYYPEVCSMKSRLAAGIGGPHLPSLEACPAEWLPPAALAGRWSTLGALSTATCITTGAVWEI